MVSLICGITPGLKKVSYRCTAERKQSHLPEVNKFPHRAFLLKGHELSIWPECVHEEKQGIPKSRSLAGGKISLWEFPEWKPRLPRSC